MSASKFVSSSFLCHLTLYRLSTESIIKQPTEDRHYHGRYWNVKEKSMNLYITDWEPKYTYSTICTCGIFLSITDVGYCRWMKRQPRIKLLCNYLLSLYRTYKRTSAWRFAGCWLKKVSLLLGSLCVCLLDRSQWSHWLNEWYDGSFYISLGRTWWKTCPLPSNGCLLLSCIVGFT
jgi:hypothetical protein